MGCLTFLVLPLLFSPFPFTIHNLVNNPMEQRDVIAHVLMIVFFYIHYFFLLPKLIEKSEWFRYIVTLIVSLALITAIPNLLIPQEDTAFPFNEFVKHHGKINQPDTFPFHDRGLHDHHGYQSVFHHIGHNLWLFLVIVFFSLTLYTLIRLRTLQRTRLDAELTQLKSQLQPHFLFNTLNSIYGAALEEKATQTAGAVMRLSGSLRYVLEENKEEYIPLEREISFLRDYIDLQKLRLGETVSISFEINGDPDGLRIAPLLLITFVENAIRHGASPEEHSDIRFVIDIKNGTLEFSAVNRKMTLWTNNNFIGSLSLEKVRERLANFYPQRHLLHISDQGDSFRVVLNIQLK